MRAYEGGTGPLADSIIETVQASDGFVLELGIADGSGSLAMIEEALETHPNNPNRLHISVEWDHNYPENRHRPMSPWWHLVRGDSRRESTFEEVSAIAADRYADVIFIDTDHNYTQMKRELELWGKIAYQKTVWLFHDTWMYGPENVDMNRAIKTFAESFGWKYDDFRKDSHGLGRMRRPK